MEPNVCGSSSEQLFDTEEVVALSKWFHEEDEFQDKMANHSLSVCGDERAAVMDKPVTRPKLPVRQQEVHRQQPAPPPLAVPTRMNP